MTVIYSVNGDVSSETVPLVVPGNRLRITFGFAGATDGKLKSLSAALANAVPIPVPFVDQYRFVSANLTYNHNDQNSIGVLEVIYDGPGNTIATHVLARVHVWLAAAGVIFATVTKIERDEVGIQVPTPPDTRGPSVGEGLGGVIDSLLKGTGEAFGSMSTGSKIAVAAGFLILILFLFALLRK